jgi:hypothetical protein
MISKLEQNKLSAQLAAIDALLATIPESNLASRIGLEERRDELSSELQTLQSAVDHLASVAIYFGGEPVHGSRAIDAEFAASALSSYQEIVTKLWSEGLREQSTPANKKILKEGSRLKLTDIVHGSFGFVLEEIDWNGMPLFRSALREAMDKSVDCISGLADRSDEVFADVMAVMNLPILTSVRNFYRILYKNKAVFRLVEGHTDQQFDAVAVERAFDRVEETTVEEENFSIEGELLGVIPMGRRFEFKRKDDGRIIAGKVGLLFSQDYLDRVSREQLTGVLRRGFFQKREVKKLGTTREVWVLTKLDNIT